MICIILIDLLLNLIGKLTENFEDTEVTMKAEYLYQNAAGENAGRTLARNDLNNSEIDHMTTHVKK